MRCHAGLTVFCPCSPSGNNFGTGLTRFVRRQLQEENGMDFRIRNVALLFLALVLVAGLASAQPGVTVKQVGSNGAVTQTKVDFSGSNGGPVPKAPTGGANGTFKYWDVLGTGGTSTNYFSHTALHHRSAEPAGRCRAGRYSHHRQPDHRPLSQHQRGHWRQQCRRSGESLQQPAVGIRLAGYVARADREYGFDHPLPLRDQQQFAMRH